MRLPRSLAGRLIGAALVAALVIWLLDLLVVAWDRHNRPTRPHRGDGDGASAAAVEAASPPPPSALASPRDLHLRPVAGCVGLAQRAQSLPPDVAPVVEVLADGGLVLRRPPPLPTSPLGPAVVARGGLGAVVLLPGGDLDALPPRARAALLGVIGELITARPVPEARLQVLDFRASSATLRRLLSWLP